MDGAVTQRREDDRSMGRALPVDGRALRRLLTARRSQLALRGALAAALSWVVAEALVSLLHGHGLDSYVYYAPLGAVVATDATMLSSARIARQASMSLAAGAVLGLAVNQTLEPSPFSLALVVGIGVLLGVFPVFGQQRSWVPVVALFVLIVGGQHPGIYAAAYVGLTALGALCGVLVCLVTPSFARRRETEALDLLRRQVADQLVELAEGLRQEPAPGPDGWAARRRDMHAALDGTRAALHELVDSERGRPHRVRRRGWVERQDDIVDNLERLALLAEDLTVIFAQTYRGDLDSSPLDPELAEVVAGALDHLAALAREYDDTIDDHDPRVREVNASMHRLTDEFSRRRDLDPGDVAVIGAVVSNLRRSTAALHPAVAPTDGLRVSLPD